MVFFSYKCEHVYFQYKKNRITRGFVKEDSDYCATTIQHLMFLLSEHVTFITKRWTELTMSSRCLPHCFRGRFTMVDYNNTDPSWEELISAVENCRDKDIVVITRKQLDIRNEGNQSNVNIHTPLV